MQAFIKAPAMKWLMYGSGWLSLALTLPVASALIASFLPTPAQSVLSDELRLALPFAALPFASARVVIWLVDKKISIPGSFDGWPYPFIEFPVVIALVTLAATTLAGPFPLMIAGIPIVFGCAMLASIGMIACELTDWIRRPKRRLGRE